MEMSTSLRVCCRCFVCCFDLIETFSIKLRLSLNLPFSCLSLSNTDITCICHDAIERISIFRTENAVLS